MKFFSPYRVAPVFLMLFIALIIYSCSKDKIESSEAVKAVATDAQLIAQAQNIFESSLQSKESKQFAVNSTTSNLPLNKIKKIVPWDKAYTQQISIGKIVMLPISYETPTFVSIGTRKISMNDLSRLFIYKDSLGGNHIELVTQIPDAAYLNRSTANQKFSGVVTVQDWQGNYLRVFKFNQDGTINNLGAPVFSEVSDADSKANTAYKKTNDFNCYENVYSGYNIAWDGSIYYWQYSGGMSCGSSGPSPSEAIPQNPLHQFTRAEDYGGGGYVGDANSTVITNNVKDSCLKRMVTAAIDHNIQYNLTQSMNSIFGNGAKFNLTFVDGTNYKSDGSIDYDTQGTMEQANTYVNSISGRPSSMDLTIKLNSNTLPNFTQEFTSTIILHEVLHAYFRATGQIDDHNVMVRDYIPWFKSALHMMYPGIEDTDLEALAYSGLTDNQAFGQFNNGLRTHYNSLREPFKNGLKGTPCVK